MQQTISILSLIMLALFSLATPGLSQDNPNIMILIADDMGRDAFSRYEIGSDLPKTPFLDSLSREGLLFMNAYSYPVCAPSRAALLTGKYGNKSSVTALEINLPISEKTIFEQIDEITDSEYANALFGKWHLGGPNHPNAQGVQHFNGLHSGGVGDYFNWTRNINGTQEMTTDYITSYITDEAINWIDEQDKPWFLWMAYTAPHSPYHVPPDGLYTRTDTTSNLDKYLCMIESLDHETARLYHSMTPQEKENTIVFFVGDNGTPNNLLQGFADRHGKGSLYEGGVNVPMFVTGKGVDRINEKENALVGFTDFFATITELLNVDIQGGTNNSLSFLPLLSDPNALTRTYNYAELGDATIDRAVRNERYKLITRADGVQEFYDLGLDSFELSNLLTSGLTTQEILIMSELQMESDSIFFSWSCNDDIQNGIEEGIDCGGASCSPCISATHTTLQDADLIVFPNPADDLLNINLPDGDYVIKILSLSANVHKQFSLQGEYLKIDLSNLASGVYLLEVTDKSSKEVLVKKLMKH